MRILFLFSISAITIQFALAYDPVEVAPDFKMPKPLSLKESLKSFQTKPGLRIELVAAEPLVMDPIHLDWGTDGKLWVVEMADYPLGIDGKGTPGGRVRFIEDRDGDGKYETSTLFLEGLNFPTGVKAWRKGVLVVAAPEIFYAEDTNGDGKADKREVLFRGFREGNQQHRVNGLVWGPDGWLHLANGDSGGKIESIKTGETLDLSSFDLRIRPDTGEMELTSGRTQNGRVRDDSGNWFGCSNSRPLFHFVLPDKFLRRNPHIIYPKASVDVSDPPVAPKVFPIGQESVRYNNAYSTGHITSACGLTIYRDDRMGGEYYGNAFVCEPVHNLVHRMVLKPKGVTFSSHRAKDEEKSEFLASSDTWFRPTAAITGPDGGLWVVDMHRFVIEHPEWIPESWQKVIDLRAGHDRGRIYRVVSDKCAKTMVPPRLDKLDDSELLKELKNPNAWIRDNAEMLLHWHGASDIPKKLSPGNTASPLQQVFALGNESSPKAGQELAKIALEHSDDPYLVAGAMSSLLPHLSIVAEATAEASIENRRPLLPYLFETAIAVNSSDAISMLLNGPAYQDTDRFESYAAFFIALDRRKIPLAKFQKKMPNIGDGISALSEKARKIASRTTAKPNERISAFLLLGRSKATRKTDLEILVSGISPGSPTEIQHAAITRLVKLGATDLLFGRWSASTPETRATILTQCLSRSTLAIKLLDALESGSIPIASIDLANRDRLIRYPNTKVKTRAAKIFAASSSKNRAEILKQFQLALKLKGNSANGKIVFQTTCMVCHKLEGLGQDLGADLTALTDKSGTALLTAILDPNQAVEDKYMLYAVTLSGGETLAAMISGESGEGITLQLLDGTIRKLLRSEIKSLKSTERSAMPEGLEAALDKQKLADLITFIQSAKREAH